MRSLVSVFLLSIPLSAGTVGTAVNCGGPPIVGSYSAACGSFGTGTGAEAEASLTGMFASAGASTGNSWDGSSASANFSADYMLTVTGGSGYGFFEPLWSGSFENDDGLGQSWGQVELGSCLMISTDGPPFSIGCTPTPMGPTNFFAFGVPEIVGYGASVTAYAGPSLNYIPQGVSGWAGGYPDLEFFDANGQPLSGITYTFVPVATPEPATLPLLTAMVCAALIAIKRHRRS